MIEIKRLCIYCGSSPKIDPLYIEVATAFGTYLAQQNIALVYGGGRIGLMGALATGTMAAGGEVIGVIPRQLAALEVAHKNLTTLITVDSMHERKSRMAELSDAFTALPGGIGTIEEFFEAYTWLQLGIHHKPVSLLNTAGYFDHLIAFIRHMETTKFLKPHHHDVLIVDEEFPSLIAKLRAFDPTPLPSKI